MSAPTDRSAGDDIVFRADSVRVRFGDRTVLNSATLWARRGRIAVVLGRNGSGKSTLFKVAAGLRQPDQGVVLFGGRAHTRPRLHRLATEGLFYLPERDLLPRHRTVRQLLRAVETRFGGSAAAHVEALQLTTLLDATTDSLSGGERRRVEVALAFTRAPACLLADEPFMGIAPRDIEVLSAAFRRLADGGCAVVMSGHEVPALMDLADEVIWLVAGTTHSLGPPAAAWQHWQFSREYMGLRRADSRPASG